MALRLHKPHDLSRDEISNIFCQLFQEAYGDTYRGDTALLRKLGEASAGILRLTENRVDAGCVVGAGGRITTIGTAPGHIVSRFNRMVSFLEEVRDEECATWISIGLQYDRMQQAARQAGFTPLHDGHQALALVNGTGELSRYRITAGGSDPVILEKNGYNQHIWTPR